jgi:ubiquinol-cytochrome c reductase cytochrome b subunit
MNAERPATWTGRVRERAVAVLPPEELLPETQPSYVASWVYVMGVLTLASLVVLIVSGCILAVEGPSWWHLSSIGHFVNSLHLWAVELFFFFMVIHLWAKFFMAAWRGGRRKTWITGAIAFVVAVPTALTGFLSHQNFSAQWISVSAKDGLNALGVGAYFNVLNFGQMFTWHIVLLPLTILLLVVVHILLVRKHGVVPPIEDDVKSIEQQLSEVV